MIISSPIPEIKRDYPLLRVVLDSTSGNPRRITAWEAELEIFRFGHIAFPLLLAQSSNVKLHLSV